MHIYIFTLKEFQYTGTRQRQPFQRAISNLFKNILKKKCLLIIQNLCFIGIFVYDILLLCEFVCLNRVFHCLLLDFNLFFLSVLVIFFCCQIELPKHKSNFILVIISTDFFINLNILCETLVLIIIFIETLGEGNIL